jgi:hypothetical protein
LGKSSNAHPKWNAKLDREIMRGGKMVIVLGSGHIVEQAHQFWTDQIFLIKREVLDDVEDDWISEDGGVKRMGGVGG